MVCICNCVIIGEGDGGDVCQCFMEIFYDIFQIIFVVVRVDDMFLLVWCDYVVMIVFGVGIFVDIFGLCFLVVFCVCEFIGLRLVQ